MTFFNWLPKGGYLSMMDYIACVYMSVRTQSGNMPRVDLASGPVRLSIRFIGQVYLHIHPISPHINNTNKIHITTDVMHSLSSLLYCLILTVIVLM